MPFRLTPAVKILLIANIGIFILQHTIDQYLGGNFVYQFGLVPSLVVLELKIWQVATYAFLHADVMHLFLNMLMLLFIGGELESVWGTRRFFIYFFVCTSGAALVYLLMQLFVVGGLQTPMVGASGGIYGMLMAYGILFGERTLLFMLVFPMKAKHFVMVLMGIELLSSVFSQHGGLSSVAHLAGMGSGFLYLWLRAWRQTRQNRPRSPKKSHLKLVVDKDPFDKDKNDSGPTWH